MENIEVNEVEIALEYVVMQAARQFAEVFTNIPEFLEFEQAYANFRQDTKAQQAFFNFRHKQESLRALIMLNAVSDEDKQELDKLQDIFYSNPSVLHYTNAQVALINISQEVGDLISSIIGLDFGNSCRTGGCCG